MSIMPYPPDGGQSDEALRRARAADRGPYRYQGTDLVADAAITAAARGGVRRCGCKHCVKARAERPLAGVGQ